MDGYVDEHGVDGLARRLAVTERHLRRLLVSELGAGPLALARTTRLQTARRLLAETAMPVTEIAFASGFSSVRQFNASFAAAYGGAAVVAAPPRCGGPGQARDGTWLDAAAGLPGAVRRRRPARVPRRPGHSRSGAGRRATVMRARYAAPGGPGLMELTLPGRARPDGQPSRRHVLLRVRLPGLRGVGRVVSRCRQLLDLDADACAIAAVLAADDVLAPLVAARPGLRVPGAYDGFELAVRAVLGQQVSVAAASTLAGRLAARFGTRLPESTGPSVLFPAPADLAEADLSGLGLTTARQATLRALATAVAGGRLALDHGADPEQTAARLGELPGIGPWTVAYILMRAVGDPDAFPGTDLGLRRALTDLGCQASRAERWRPWRAYAAVHLWTWHAQASATKGG